MSAARSYPKPAHRRAIGIKRVSLLLQVGNYSFDGQGNKFAMLADKWDCDIPPELMIEDKGYSGTDFNRPSIKKAQAMIRAGVANAVAFPWIDRFAREVEGGLATIRQFRELGADVLLGDLGWYSTEGHFRFQMNMFLSVAQYQRDDIADKSRWAVQAKLEGGLAHFGAPYGWHMVTALEIAARALRDGKDVPTGKPQNFYERVIENLEVVQLMGELALAGGREGSQRGICRELAARGIKSPKGKLEWNPVTVTKLLHSEVYSTGTWHYGKREYVELPPECYRKRDKERHRVRTRAKERPRDQWGEVELPGGPIWTPDEQAAIQEALVRNGGGYLGKPARSRMEGGREAQLKGLCKCAATVTGGDRIGEECLGAVTPRHDSVVKLDGTRSMWYICTHRSRTTGKNLCDGKSVKAELLEDAVWQSTKQAVCEDLDTLIAAHYGQITKEEDASLLTTLRAEYKRKEQHRKDAMRLQIEARDAADKAEYAGLVAKYKADLALLDRRIQNAASESEAEQLDTATVKQQARRVFNDPKITPEDRRAIFLDWVREVRYAHGWATVTISVSIPVNRKQAEHAAYNKQLLLTTRFQVAA